MGERAEPQRVEARQCFICGPDNPIGLRLRFHEDGAGIAADFVPSEAFVGYDGLVHGGVVAAVMDDAMANVWAHRGQPAVTVRLSVKFRRPVRPGQRLRVFAVALSARRGASQRVRAVVSHGDQVVAEGEGIVLVGERARLGANGP